jgi:hypothetical protein
MYLLHGMGGSEASWHDNDLYAHIQLDNLLAQQKVKPFIIVFTRNDMNNWAFGPILFNELIPYVEQNYSVSTDPRNRALGGLSMGGMQTINFGFPNADKVHYLMPSSSAPGIQGQSQLFPNSGAVAKANLKLIFFTCGSGEANSYGCQNNATVRGYAQTNGLGTIIKEFVAQGGGHNAATWRPSFWNFAQLADAAGLTNVGTTSISGNTAPIFAAMTAFSGSVDVFDSRGKFLKGVLAPAFSDGATGLAPGSYFLKWQSGNRIHTRQYSTGHAGERLELE